MKSYKMGKGALQKRTLFEMNKDYFLPEPRLVPIFFGAGGAGFFLEAALGRAALGAGLAGAELCLGGTARIRHLGPEPMRSSRCAFRSASFTR